MMLIRRMWFRIAVLVVALCLVNAILGRHGYLVVRGEAIKALQGSTFIFAICAAFSIAIFTNYVRGMRDLYLRRVSDVRNMLEKCFDTHKESDDTSVQTITNVYLIPLLRLSTREWLTYEPVQKISDNLVGPAEKLHVIDKSFLPRYLLRIEDELNELGLLYIRRIVTRVHMETITGTIYLVVAGIIALGFSYVAPASSVASMVVVNASAAFVILAALELLLLFSYLQQEGREEQPECDGPDAQET